MLDRADCREAREPAFWAEALGGSKGRPAKSSDRHGEGNTEHGAMNLARVIVLHCRFEQTGANASATKNLS